MSREKDTSYEVRFIRQNEWDDAMALAWKTFLRFEAADYSEEGTANFRDFITDTNLKRMFDRGRYQVMGAYDGEHMVGMIALRNESHISLLFVDKEYHYRGIGRSLVMAMDDYVKQELGKTSVSVNASPYAVEFYHKIGFRDAGLQTHSKGIIYTPMRLKL